MLPSRDREDIIQLLERTLLSLWNKEEDEKESRDVEASVEGEGTDRVESAEDTREGDGEDGSPEEAGGDGPGHADFAVG